MPPPGWPPSPSQIPLEGSGTRHPAFYETTGADDCRDDLETTDTITYDAAFRDDSEANDTITCRDDFATIGTITYDAAFKDDTGNEDDDARQYLSSEGTMFYTYCNECEDAGIVDEHDGGQRGRERRGEGRDLAKLPRQKRPLEDECRVTQAQTHCPGSLPATALVQG